MAELTPGQQSFLEMADRAGVSHDLFGQYKPDIQFQEAQPDATKSTIAYIHTGGTLAMVPSNDGGTISFEGAVNLPKIIEVCNYIAQVRRRYNIIGIHLANIDSKEIKPDAWTAMAATIKTVYDLIDGATLGHGTHTLEYSAAASSYALRNLAVPIVFAASQIPSVGFPGSDGIPNLTGAMEIAANGDFAEVLAYANGTIHRGSRVTKENDSRLNIFESKVTGPMGYFGAAGIEVGDGARRRMGKRKHELIFQPEFNSSIPSLKINPSIGPDLLRELLSGTEKAVGAVLETYGSAALPNDL
ncbi:MAG TPA: asparaginase, partial [Candidatus Gracilibacteria bacterium]